MIELKIPIPAFRPGVPEDFIKTPLPTPWPEEGIEAGAPIFENFLAEIFGEVLPVIDFLSRCLGYAIQGNPIENILLIFLGIGRNGKTTLLEILGFVLGYLAGPIKAKLLLLQNRVQSSSGANADVLTLRGKRLVWASETDEGRQFNAGRTKHLTGHDSIVARAPFGRREIAFLSSHTIVLSTNHLPPASASDYALWAKLRLIPFNFSFVDEPKKPNERKRDPDLLEKLKAEAPGILVWLVKSWIKYMEEGLIPPDEVKAATAGYHKDQDSIAQFLDACCIQGPSHQAKVSRIRAEYDKWAGQEGISPVRPKAFKEYLNERFTRAPRDK